MHADDHETPRLLGLLAGLGRVGWQVVGIALALAALGWLFSRLQLVLLTLFVGLVLATVVRPITAWLTGRGLGHTAATAMATAVVATVVVTSLGVVGWRLSAQLPQLDDELAVQRERAVEYLGREPLSLSEAEVEAVLERTAAVLAQAGGDEGDTATAPTSGDATEESDDGEGPSPSAAVAVLVAAFGAARTVGFGAIGVVVAFFLVRDRTRITDGVVRHLAGGPHDHRARQVLDASSRAFAGYVRGAMIVGAVDAAAIGLVLFLVGTPLAASLTLLTFLAGFVPVLGAMAAGLLAVGFTLLAVGPVPALVVLATSVVVQQLDGNVLQPAVMASETALHPLATLFALLVGGLLGGALGALLAVPLAAMVTAAARVLLDPEDADAAAAAATS